MKLGDVFGRQSMKSPGMKRAGLMAVVLSILLLLSIFSGCEGNGGSDGSGEDAQAAVPELTGHALEETVKPDYAEGFVIYRYADGYEVIDVKDEASGSQVMYLLIPEKGEMPPGLPEEMIVLQKPLDHIYLAASASMALISALDGLDSVKFTATQENDWYVDEAKKAMEEGRIVYAGKYSQPDYEMLLDEGCDLAVESTMILHTPTVQEKLEGLDIPVFIDQSSYESHPLGRSEWIRVYGAMLDKDEEAETFFEEQKAVISDLEGFENTGKTVAFFYLNSQDQAVVRASDDYIPEMIDIAGGKYVFTDLKNPNEESRSAVVKMSMEEFYEQASDADYLIYNASIESPLGAMEDLTEKSPLFAKFKAVKAGNVWTTDKYLYQATDIMGQLIRDFHLMLTGGDEKEMIFLKKVK